MAVFDRSTKLIDLIKPGVTPNSEDRGVSWIQNLEKFESSWKVRPGFGTRAVLDSCLTTGKEAFGNYPVGIDRHLGSFLIRDTSFGHAQIISVFRMNAYTSDFRRSEESFDNWKILAQYRSLYTVFIYDLETDDRWEVPLHLHTSEMGAEIPDRHGVYESVRSDNFESDYQVWIDAGQNELGPNREFNADDEEFFWFAEQKDSAGRTILHFGSKRAGAWIYTPIDPRYAEKTWRQRRMSVQGVYTSDYRDPYAESSCVRPLPVRDGIFAVDGLTYLTQDEFSKPQAVCVLDNRLVYAVDNVLYFSDPEDANAILDGNVQPFQAKIVAVAPTLGNLIVWTEDDRTFYYNPAKGDLISGGRTTEISDSVGILGPNAWVNVEGAIIWVAKNGIYRNYGNTSVNRISKPIQDFFEDGISNPLLNYYTANGASAGDEPQPTSFYQWNAISQTGVNLSYEPSAGQVFINLPELRLSFILEDGGYHFWNYESVVSMSGSSPIVQAQRNLPRPWILAHGNSVFAVTDVREQSQTDTTNYDESATGFDVKNRSFAICELGRGGALDASIVDQEDRRIFTGEWFDNGQNEAVTSAVRDRGFFFINKPIKIAKNYEFNWANTFVSASDASPMYIPIELVPSKSDVDIEPHGTDNINNISMEFKFDNTHWKPYLNESATNNYEVVFDLPPERLGARGAYFIGSADDTLEQGIWVEDSSSGNGDPDGDTIRIELVGASGSHTTSPNFGFISRYRNPICRLAFRRVTGSNDDTFALGIETITANTLDSRAIQSSLAVRVWEDQTRAMLTSQPIDSVQAVDWVYTGEEINSGESGFMMKARGVSMDVESSGNAGLQSGDPGQAGWPLRIFNSVISTNYKQYAAQLLDFATSPNALIKVTKNAIRKRMGDNANATNTATFNELAEWGSHSDSATGNFLIGDAEVDNIKTSVGVKGDKVVAQMFGHMLSPAEKFRIAAARVYARIMKGFRRKGR